MRRIAANDRQPVRRKAAQAGPFTFNAADIPVDNLLQPINGKRDIIFFRCGVAWRRCGLVMWAQPQTSARIGLEIETAIKTNDERQGRRHIGCNRQLRNGTAIGLNAQGRNARHLRHMIGPGPCGIDDNIGGAVQAARLDMPHAVTPYGTLQPAVAMWLNALLARLAQIGRVERGDINIRTGRLP